ncbi:hypothetical protein RCZ04_21940 [Capnocytophaga sp. HP1101]
MKANYYDLELTKILRKHIKDEELQIVDSDFYVEYVNVTFPFVGSRIDFKALNEYKMLDFKNDETDKILSFIDDIQTTVLVLDEKVIYLGDNLTNLTYIFPFKDLNKVIIAILNNIPEHHYFFNKTMEWVICVSFGKCIEFGRI